MREHAPTVAIVVVVLLLTVTVGHQVVTATTSPDALAYYDQSEQWCVTDRGGELWNANVLGSHGGLHCELPNGTDVHMREVIEVD